MLLLNNDTEVDKNFVGEMLAAIKRHKKAFSCSARLICYHDRDKLDDAGNYLILLLVWAYARGKGKESGKRPWDWALDCRPMADLARRLTLLQMTLL